MNAVDAMQSMETVEDWKSEAEAVVAEEAL